MGLARTTVYVREDSRLGEHPFVRDSGEPCAWLEIGDHEVGVWGSPPAMRRLAAAVSAAADAADQLVERHPNADPATRVAA
jgi:hypothetical protein